VWGEGGVAAEGAPPHSYHRRWVIWYHIGVRWEGATPPYRTVHISSWARVGGADPGPRVSPSVRPCVREMLIFVNFDL